MKNFTRQVCPKVVAQARQRPRFTEWSIAVAGGASKYAGKSRRESEGSVIKQKMENQNKIKSSEKNPKSNEVSDRGSRVSFEAIGRGKAEPRGSRLQPGSFLEARGTTPREGGVR